MLQSDLSKSLDQVPPFPYYQNPSIWSLPFRIFKIPRSGPALSVYSKSLDLVTPSPCIQNPSIWSRPFRIIKIPLAAPALSVECSNSSYLCRHGYVISIKLHRLLPPMERALVTAIKHLPILDNRLYEFRTHFMNRL